MAKNYVAVVGVNISTRSGRFANKVVSGHYQLKRAASTMFNLTESVKAPRFWRTIPGISLLKFLSRKGINVTRLANVEFYYRNGLGGRNGKKIAV